MLLAEENHSPIPRNEIAKSELALLEQGVPLFLVYYDIMEDRLFTVTDQERFKFTPKRK